MLARSISRACFSVNWSAPFESVTASLKRQPPDYIRNNAHHIFSYMFDLIDGNRWAQVNTYLNHLNYRFVDRWELWERLGDEIDNNINKSIAIDDEQIFFEMLRVCKAVNYEITPSRHSFVYEHSLKLIEQSRRPIDTVNNLAQTLLILNPSLFEPYNGILQERIKNALECRNLTKTNRHVIIMGIKAGFWSKQFMGAIKKYVASTSDVRLEGLLEFADLDIPNAVVEQKTNRSSTEIKIGAFLRDLGYQLQENVAINKSEVDFLILGKVILEYNGPQHYIINSLSSTPSLIAHDRWRNSVFADRGFHTFSIPFYEWETHLNEKQQKQYLILKIENSLMEMYAHSSGHSGSQGNSNNCT